MSLELNTEHGEPTQIKVDGQVLQGVKLISIESEPGMTAIQIEMEPTATATLEEGQIHWFVCCPNCKYNSVHTCELDNALEPEDRLVAEEYEDRTVSGEVTIVPSPSLGYPPPEAPDPEYDDKGWLG